MLQPAASLRSSGNSEKQEEMQFCKWGGGVPLSAHPLATLPLSSLSPNPDPHSLKAPSSNSKPQFSSSLRVKDDNLRGGGWGEGGEGAGPVGCQRPQPERAKQGLRVCESPSATGLLQILQLQHLRVRGRGGGGGSYSSAPSGRCPKLGGRPQAESRAEGGHVTPAPGTNQRPQEGGHTRRPPPLPARSERDAFFVPLSALGGPRTPRPPLQRGDPDRLALSPTAAPPPRPGPCTLSGPDVRQERAQGRPRCGAWTAEWGGGASPGQDHRTGPGSAST